MAKQIIIPALKISQPAGKKREIFLGKIKIKELLDETKFKIDFWDPKRKRLKNQGYQRKPSPTRARKIAKYIQDGTNPIFPTTVLINSRQKIYFEAEDKKLNTGKLILGKSPSKYPLYIVDGQHRITGFRHAVEELKMNHVKEMEVPVVFLNNFEQIEEVKQFHILNSTQKKVATDLAQRLIHQIIKEDPKEYKKVKERGMLWEIKALVIVDLLNEKEESPWFRRIRLPNSPRIARNIVNQTSFVRSLKPLLKDGILSAYPYHLPDDAYKILKNYWLALKDLFPDAFLRAKEYVVQKTPGIFSLHQLANPVLLTLNNKSLELLHANIRKVLKKVFPEDKYGSDYWRADNDEGAAMAGSMKGFRMLAEEFIENLRNAY